MGVWKYYTTYFLVNLSVKRESISKARVTPVKTVGVTGNWGNRVTSTCRRVTCTCFLIIIKIHSWEN